MHWTRAFDRGAAIGLLAALWLLLGAFAANATPVTLYADGGMIAGFDEDDVADAVTAGFAAPLTVCQSKLNPSTGTSTWTLQIADDTPEDLLQDFYLVILGHDQNDPQPYFTMNVGLEVETGSPWTLFRNEVAPDQVYLAYFLGDLDPLLDYQIPIEYRVGQALFIEDGEFIFPRYSIAFLAGVPEPSTLMLLAAAFAGLWVAGKRPA
jgi:hypothetical protein